MSKQFNPKHFFRKASNAFIKEYFNAKGILTDFDFEALPEAKVDPLYEAWQGLERDVRESSERDFQDIHQMADEGGVKAILDEANSHSEDLSETLSALSNFQDKAIWTFLNRPQYWRGALLFRHADSISPRSWRKRKNVPKIEPKTDAASLRDFEKEIGLFFLKREARGRNCRVECYRRIGMEYFFCYPEDYSQAIVEWNHDDFDRKPHRPAFEIIFVYNRTEGTLDVHFSGVRTVVGQLQRIFSDRILGKPLGEEQADERVYDLDRVKNPDFEFVYEPGSGIESAVICKMRLFVGVANRERITIEVSPGTDNKAIYRLLSTVEKAVKPRDCLVNHVGVKAVIIDGALDAKNKTRSFSLTWPNACTLKHEGADLALRKMLAASGLEPTAPAPDGEPSV